MALNYSEVQSYIDNDGYVYFDKGTHTLTQKVVFDGSKQTLVEAHPQATVVYTGSSPNAPFQFEQDVASPQRLIFRRITATSSVSGSPIFKTAGITDTPNFLLMEYCNFSCVGAYNVDVNRAPYIITPVFRYMKTSGGGAIRWKARTGGNDPYHTTSQMEVTGWHHDGSNRVGPAFNFRGTSGLRMTDIYDSGDPSLLAALRGVYEGPVSFRIDSCRTPATITNWRWKPTQDFTNASGCYLHEVRTDSGTGTGKHEYLQWINGTIRDANIDGGVKPFRIMGGETNGGDHSLVVDFFDCEDLTVDDFLFGGKLWCRVRRNWVNPGGESAASAMETLFNSTLWYSGSMTDTIYTDTDRIPSGSNDGGDLYQTGLSLYDDRTTAQPEYEDLL